ncbi:MAG: helix-turn-helix domain-containing protein [Treponema sp.]|nr:helix-turn-helix domain-containing protein [Treponema sp.]
MEQTYGERLAAAIKLRGLKQADFAKKINITQTAVSKIINGTQYLDFDLAVKACEVLDISLSWLAYGIDRETKPQFYRNPERQRIEYLMTIMKEAEYPLVIVAMEEIIEIRLRETPPDKPGKPNKSGSVNKPRQKS